MGSDNNHDDNPPQHKFGTEIAYEQKMVTVQNPLHQQTLQQQTVNSSLMGIGAVGQDTLISTFQRRDNLDDDEDDRGHLSRADADDIDDLKRE